MEVRGGSSLLKDLLGYFGWWSKGVLCHLVLATLQGGGLGALQPVFSPAYLLPSCDGKVFCQLAEKAAVAG